MSTPDRFVVPSRYGLREWVRTARGSGPETSPRLDTWASNCVFCGREFEINIRRNVTPGARQHRPPTTARAWRGLGSRMSRRNWRAEFVEIKRAKLEADAAPEGSPPVPPGEHGP
jgi:hypothetical protein